VAWFGFRSFWGPLYHLVASAIATEDIDSRDWMKPDDPRRLVRRVATVLSTVPLERDADSLTELVDRDVWPIRGTTYPSARPSGTSWRGRMSYRIPIHGAAPRP
jgi:hypothetical protein